MHAKASSLIIFGIWSNIMDSLTLLIQSLHWNCVIFYRLTVGLFIVYKILYIWHLEVWWPLENLVENLCIYHIHLFVHPSILPFIHPFIHPFILPKSIHSLSSMCWELFYVVGTQWWMRLRRSLLSWSLYYNGGDKTFYKSLHQYLISLLFRTLKEICRMLWECIMGC